MILVFLVSTGGNSFIETHEQDLIERIKNVYPVLHDLYFKYLLTEKDCDNILQAPDCKDMMRRLYDVIRCWDDDEKEEVYHVLYTHNPGVIDDLKNLDNLSTLKQPSKCQCDPCPFLHTALSSSVYRNKGFQIHGKIQNIHPSCHPPHIIKNVLEGGAYPHKTPL